MTTPNIEALERLCDLLAQQIEAQDALSPPIIHLRMDLWAHGRSECGTTACAVGLACLDPWFQERGLFLVTARGTAAFTVEELAKVTCMGRTVMPIHKTPSGPPEEELAEINPYEWPLNYHAAASFFGIPEPRARYLFDPDEYERSELGSPQAVLNRVEKLLARLKLEAEARREAGLT
jgi:hypothetical protein